MILEWFLRFLPNVSKLKEHPEGVAPSDTQTSKARSTDVDGSFFHQATNFTVNGANMFDRPQIFQTIHNTITTGTATLDRLFPHTCPDAAIDSNARHPPPRCHPGTRQRILNTLNDWLISHLWKIFWLSGPAGTGKSAVAQSFAEACFEQGRLGAAYFFLRSSGRNDPLTVIPSLAYQLAVNLPDYGNLLGHAIARDPAIFQKTPRIQLLRLIVEPFTLLQAQGHKIIREPLLIILDGLDECQGVEAQCEFVEMVGEVVRLKKDLPLLWMIASRPEPHLQYIFSRADFSINCSKEVLLIDVDTRDDVDRYLRDKFVGIRTRFPLVTNDTWPPEVQLQRVEDIASGLFALAATIIRYVSDATYGDPVGRLVDFLAFTGNIIHVTTTNPLQILDLLYSQILSEIPESIYPVTKRVLAFYIIIFNGHLSAQLGCNLLRMDRSEFYNALSKLHSLFDILSPDNVAEASLTMHHASFGDYLRSPFRAGRFHIRGDDYLIDCLKTFLFWYTVILEDPCYVSDDSFKMIEKSTALPGLKWASNDHNNNLAISQAIITITSDMIWSPFLALSHDYAEEILDQLEDFDFRYMFVSKDDEGKFARFVEWLFSSGSRNTLLRTEALHDLDKTLLDTVTQEIDRRMEPAVFPLMMINSESPYRYLFIGHIGSKRTCLFWFNEACDLVGRCRFSCKALFRERYNVSDCVIHYPE